MRRNKKYYQLLIISGLFWAFYLTILRGLRWPNDFAEAHWLISYEFGFLKRGLLGTLLAPFLNPENNEYSQMIVRFVSTFFLLVFFVGLFWMSLRILKKSKFNIYSVFVILLFLTSPYVVMSAHLNGYFDNILIIISLLATWFVIKEKNLLAGIIVSIGILSHETMLLVGFPSVIFVGFMKYIESRKNNDIRIWQLLIGFLNRYKTLLLLPFAVFALIFVNQTFFLDSTSIENKLITHVSAFKFVRAGRNVMVPRYVLTSFFEYFKLNSPDFSARITDSLYTRNLISLLILLIFCWRSLNKATSKIIIFSFLLIITLLPLTLHAIAHDTSRIWTYPLIVTMFALWGIKEVFPNNDQGEKESLFYLMCIIMTVIMHVLIVTPLMDGGRELSSPEMRIVLYAPPLILISFLVSRYYNLQNQHKNNNS